MDAIETVLEGVCKPLLVYNVVMAALITYDATQGDIKAIVRNSVFLILGSGLIWILCTLGFTAAAWILLSLPPFFLVALLALLVITQIVNTNVKYDDGNGNMITGDKLRDALGMGRDPAETGKVQGKDLAFYAGPTGGKCVDDTVPTPPGMNAGDKIRLQMHAADAAEAENKAAAAAAKEAASCGTCSTCNTCETSS